MLAKTGTNQLISFQGEFLKPLSFEFIVVTTFSCTRVNRFLSFDQRYIEIVGEERISYPSLYLLISC